MYGAIWLLTALGIRKTLKDGAAELKQEAAPKSSWLDDGGGGSYPNVAAALIVLGGLIFIVMLLGTCIVDLCSSK